MHEEHFSPPLKTLEMKLYSVLAHDPVGDQTGEHILISFLVLNLRLWEEGQKKKKYLPGLWEELGLVVGSALGLQMPQLLNGMTVSKVRPGGMCLQLQHLEG